MNPSMPKLVLEIKKCGIILSMLKSAYLVFGAWRPIYSEGRGVTRSNRGGIFVAHSEDFGAHLLVLESIFTGV